MTKNHYFIINPIQNEDEETMVKLTETIVTDTASSFSIEIMEGENPTTDEYLELLLSEIAMTYVSGEGIHTENIGLDVYDFTYNLA